ncbi:MAG: ATP-GRASP peptide maturase of grasp-with-spasm system [Crocinitomix sp.]|jgi:ATP-GRASP peptide maturase of grasp-with-spasm system
MILIYSFEEDHSTNEVVKWLNYLEVPFLRINKFQDISTYFLSQDDGNSDGFNFSLKTEGISAVWYRKNPKNIVFEHEDPIVDADLLTIGYNEARVIYNYLNEELNDRYWLNHPSSSSPNKLSVLKKAQQAGLKIPPTLVTKHKSELELFYRKHKSIITKPLFEVTKVKDNNGNTYMSRTVEISREEINESADIFYASLFQKNIEKKFEVRMVYLEGTIYSMAILSQQSEETKIDFRVYNIDFPNRLCAINVPEEISIGVDKLMKKMNLNFGSIDFMVDNNGEYYFLEINPVGQFGMTSTPNNYNIERKVAEILKDNHERYERRKN